MVLAVDLLNPSLEKEKRTHKLKRLVQSPNSWFMDVKCSGCFAITTIFSHAQTVVLCNNCSQVLCQPTGGRVRLIEELFAPPEWRTVSGHGLLSRLPCGAWLLGSAGSFHQMWRSFLTLMWKNAVFTRRRWPMAVLQWSAPLLFLAMLMALDGLPKSIQDNPYNPFPQVLSQPEIPLGPVARCRPWAESDCKTIRFALDRHGDGDAADEWNLKIFLPIFLDESGLERRDVEQMPSPDALRQHILQHPNTTTNGLIFHSLSGGNFSYTLLFNATYDFLVLIAPARKPENRNELQIAVDKALIRMHHLLRGGAPAPSSTGLADVGLLPKLDGIVYSTRLYPNLGYKGGKTAVDDNGPVFFYCGLMFQALVLLYNISHEKEYLLRQGLKLIGLRDSIYWLSWLVFGLLVSAVATVVLIVSGWSFNLTFFRQVDVSLNFVVFSMFGLATIGLIFFTSVWIQRTKSSLNAAMFHFILGLLLVSLTSNPDIKHTLNDPSATWTWVPTLLSFLFPAYNLGECLAELSKVSSIGPDGLDSFGWLNFTQLVYFNKTVNGTMRSYHSIPMPNAFDSVVRLMLNFVIYTSLALYLDQILSSANGEPRPWYFPLLPSTWGLHELQRFLLRGENYGSGERNVEDSEALLRSACEFSSDIQSERSYVMNQNPLASDGPALQIRGISKKFRKESLGPCVNRRHLAVSDLWLAGEQDQILALLGRNGAGKSTTFKTMIGLIRPTSGDGFLYGKSIRWNQDDVRKMIGVCPQHDVLWDDLTAREHVELIGALKSVPVQQLGLLTFCLLNEVGLYNVADCAVKTFSGGMKRRLSAAMSFIGNPKVVFLDEPTTGMDPCVRRDIWNLILRMRRGRAIVMTTHSMEEADVLGDKIAVLSQGKLLMVGSSTNLKNRFAGYRLTVAALAVDLLHAQSFVETRLPGCAFEQNYSSLNKDRNGVSFLSYSMPPSSDTLLIDFFKAVETDKRLGKCPIQDCNISQTTLEEVFLRVTSHEGHSGDDE